MEACGGGSAPDRDRERNEEAQAMLSDSQWWEFYQQGFLRLGQLLDGGELAALQERIDEIMLGKVRYENMMMQLDGGGAYEDLPSQSAGFKGSRLDYRKIQDLE